MKSTRQKAGNFAKASKPKAGAGAGQKGSHRPFGHVTTEWLEAVSAGTERNIRDTPAWQEGVQRLGLKEARRRLRLYCLASQCPAADPGN